LPSMICLVLAHGIFAGLVPGTAGCPAHVVFADESFLNRLRPLRIDLLLTARLRRFLSRRALPGRGRMSLARGGS
jgi:hypothetical protein